MFHKTKRSNYYKKNCPNNTNFNNCSFDSNKQNDLLSNNILNKDVLSMSVSFCLCEKIEDNCKLNSSSCPKVRKQRTQFSILVSERSKHAPKDCLKDFENDVCYSCCMNVKTIQIGKLLLKQVNLNADKMLKSDKKMKRLCQNFKKKSPNPQKKSQKNSCKNSCNKKLSFCQLQKKGYEKEFEMCRNNIRSSTKKTASTEKFCTRIHRKNNPYKEKLWITCENNIKEKYSSSENLRTTCEAAIEKKFSALENLWTCKTNNEEKCPYAEHLCSAYKSNTKEICPKLDDKPNRISSLKTGMKTVGIFFALYFKVKEEPGKPLPEENLKLKIGISGIKSSSDRKQSSQDSGKITKKLAIQLGGRSGDITVPRNQKIKLSDGREIDATIKAEIMPSGERRHTAGGAVAPTVEEAQARRARRLAKLEQSKNTKLK